ncbi:hypothetical protein KQX54_018723 [Cotesia glomerata]|uniref:BEN domain-containing protein n=1 Tax=Cotesia glomerata TaxID=32391 RepID=A0AAV7IR55_COTGL|nr:hypothetical protein KQX54_018723 [Cotesia glomerata]
MSKLNKVRKAKHALIWWIDTAQTDVVLLTKLPKECRKVDAERTVVWKNYQTKKTSKSKLKVLAIDCKKKQLKESAKLQDGIKKSNKKTIEAKILNQKPILSKIFSHVNECNNQVNGTSTYITSYPNLTQISQPEYPPLPANNNCIYVGTSTSFDLNTGPNDHTDQQYYEFPSTAKPRPDCQVIEMKKIDESIYTQNIPINTKQYELKDRNETLTDVQNSDSLKTCSNSKVAPEMTNLLSALIPETKGNYDNSAICISRDYLKNGVNKVELPQKSGFYLAKDVFLNIQEEAGNDWTKIVSETINEVYGTEIKNFSARGRYSAGRPKINPKLFKGLLNWTKTIDDSVTMEKITKKINDLVYHARKAENESDSDEAKTIEKGFRKIISEKNDDTEDENDENEDQEASKGDENLMC